MKTKTIIGLKGISTERAVDIFVLEQRNGISWYCCDGDTVVNATQEVLRSGCNVGKIYDVDCFTWPEGIRSEDDLIAAVEA